MKKTKQKEINERGRKIKELESKIAKMQKCNERYEQIKRLQADKNEQSMALDAVTEERDRLKFERDQLFTEKDKCSAEIKRLRSNLYDAETEIKGCRESTITSRAVRINYFSAKIPDHSMRYCMP